MLALLKFLSWQASKAAISQFFETLRIELGQDIKITLVTPGFVESELTQGKYIGKGGYVEVDQGMRDVSFLLLLVSAFSSGLIDKPLRVILIWSFGFLSMNAV